MPAKSIEIIWTALPAGVSEPGSMLRLSVHISPRLMTDEGLPRPTLDQFADYFGDWPALVRGLRFEVRFTPGPTVEAERMSEPSSELWAALFPPDTYVHPYEFQDPDDTLVYSYPIANVQNHLRKIYERYAQSSPDRFPAQTDLLLDDDLLAIRFVKDPEEARQIDARLGRRTTPASEQELQSQLLRRMRQGIETRRGLSGPAMAVAPGPPDPTLDFFQVTNFFTPKNTPKPDQPVVDKYGTSGTIKGEYERIAAAIPLPDVDFHQIVSTLGQYPKLLRELGLVIDLDVPMEGGIVGDAAPLDQPNVQVVPIWPAGTPAPIPSAVQPRTVYVLQGNRFIARPQPTDADVSETGLLRLNEEGYDLVQMDVDGAAIKAMNFTYNLHRSILHRSSDSPVESSLPALRTAGLALARTGNALRLATKFKLMAQLQTDLPMDPNPTLYAEDVMRGYRLDVWDDKSKRWRSLHQRIGDYVLDAGPERTYRDEGFTQTATASSADGSSGDLFLHEVFANWEGWSLSAPKPGAWLTDDSNSERDRDRANTELRMESAFRTAPGSLPKLRFGTGYRLRVRAVDLAGNSPVFEGLDSETVHGALNRVAANDDAASDEQAYLRLEPLGPPAVVLRNEINSVPGASLEHLVIRSFNDQAEKDELPTDETTDRHIAPPKGAWSLAEAHGKLDLPPSQAEDADRLREIHALILKKDGAFEATKPVPTEQEAGAVYPIAASDTIDELPYLPDPIARGSALIDLPGVPEGKAHHMTAGGATQVSDLEPVGAFSLTRVDFVPDDAWYDIGGFRLHVVDATGQANTEPRWEVGQRVLTVYLPKADVVRVPFSSFLNDDDLDLMGIWDWLRQAAPGNLNLLKRTALDGRHWMLTPRRELMLVHAVQQPLQRPAFGALEAERGLGQVFATLRDTMQISAKSTIKLDLRSEWSEWIDVLSEPEPRRVTGTAHVGEIKVEDATQDSIPIALRHDFGDTKYRRVCYRAVATTRFREYFPPEIRNDEAAITRSTIDDPAEPEDAPFASPVIDVPNSARPEAPKVLYVVPAFRWSEGPPDTLEDLAATPDKEPGIVSQREGGWLRVYLDRPWYSSGDGELLGALIWTDAFTRIPVDYQPYVTIWGNDPVWRSDPTAGAATLAAFKNAAATKTGGLTLEELTRGLPARLMPAAARFRIQDPTPLSQVQRSLLQTQETRIQAEAKPPEPQIQARPEALQAQLQQIPTLAVAGHQVKYDPSRRLWYADIHIDAGPSYYPFVRLALVRYQPISVPNAHISSVVLADFAQLTPDRTVSLSFDPKKPREVRMTVSGVTFDHSQVMKEPGPLRIRVEQLRPDVPDDFGWVPARGTEIDREDPRGRGARPLWTGKITLPEPRGSRRYRVLIEEFEQYAYVPAEVERGRVRQASRSSRVVYAQAVEL